MNRSFAGFFWITLYLIVVLAPVLLMLLPPIPAGRAFWVELSVALGFVGLTQIGVQFVLIARFKRVTAPYGIDIILQYHRKIALVAVILILAHPLLLLIEHPARIVMFNPLQGTWASRAGLLSVGALLVLVVTSLWREELKLNYERWRLAHALLGILALAMAQVHVSLAGLYINTAGKQAFWIVSSILLVSLVGYLRLVKPVLMRRRKWRVVGIKDEGAETYGLILEPVGHEGMPFEPGQFAWIKVDDSPYSLDEHPFSFASSAERPERLVFGIKALGDFSSNVPHLPEGACAYVDGPHGAFTIDRWQGAGYVFIAGGIGITPMMSFLHTMADRGDRRPVTLIFAVAREEALAFRTEIEELHDRMNLDVIYVLEEVPEGSGHERGFITAELLERRLPRERFLRQFFVCGPPVMMDAVEDVLDEYGIPRANIHLEKFELA
jgi:predicted ferric reductase